jgi:hypothetical protein
LIISIRGKQTCIWEGFDKIHEFQKTQQLLFAFIFLPSQQNAWKAEDMGLSDNLIHRTDYKLQPLLSGMSQWFEEFFKTDGYD